MATSSNGSMFTQNPSWLSSLQTLLTVIRAETNGDSGDTDNDVSLFVCLLIVVTLTVATVLADSCDVVTVLYSRDKETWQWRQLVTMVTEKKFDTKRVRWINCSSWAKNTPDHTRTHLQTQSCRDFVFVKTIVFPILDKFRIPFAIHNHLLLQSKLLILISGKFSSLS